MGAEIVPRSAGANLTPPDTFADGGTRGAAARRVEVRARRHPVAVVRRRRRRGLGPVARYRLGARSRLFDSAAADPRRGGGALPPVSRANRTAAGELGEC